MGGRDLDLHLLYQEVTSRGGLTQASLHRIAHADRLSALCSSTGQVHVRPGSWDRANASVGWE